MIQLASTTLEDGTVVRVMPTEEFHALFELIKTEGQGDPSDEYEFNGMSLYDGMPEYGIQKLTPGLTEILCLDEHFDSFLDLIN